MAGPLESVRILDLTSMISGPTATMMLADQGGDVIKVDNPKSCDFARTVLTRRNGVTASFMYNNRNKRSVALDLKDPQGIDALIKLATGCDVMVLAPSNI